MGRVPKVRTAPPRSLVPWWISDADLVPAEPFAITRDLVKDGIPQRQVAFCISGQTIPVLALMAVRCERRQTPTGEELWPLSVAWPCETALDEYGQTPEAGQSGMNRAPRTFPDDDGG